MYFSFKDDKSKYNLIVIAFYTQLLNYIIPLSMYVTIGINLINYKNISITFIKIENYLELQRFIGSQFIEWDLE